MKKLGPFLVLLLLLAVSVTAVGTVVLLNSTASTSSATKLGIFVRAVDSNASQIVSSGPAAVKFLLANQADQSEIDRIVNSAKSYKAKKPNGVVLLRIWDNWYSAPKYDPASVPADDAANEVFDSYKGTLAKLRNSSNLQYFDYIAGPTNETERTPFWSKGIANDPAYNTNWLSRFWYTLIDLNRKAGIKTCAGNILTGDLPLNSESIKTVKIVLLPRLAETGSVICYHGYSDNGFSKDPSVQEEHPLEYRRFYKAVGSTSVKMIIGELGIADGWQKAGSAQQFEDWLTWYDSEIKKDSQIIAATIYEIGAKGPDSVAPITSWLSSYFASNGGGGGTPSPTPTGSPTQTPTSTPTPTPTPTPVPGAKCQGDYNASAKCYSCKKDSPIDQLNILDFSCFAKEYGKDVGYF